MMIMTMTMTMTTMMMTMTYRVEHVVEFVAEGWRCQNRKRRRNWFQRVARVLNWRTVVFSFRKILFLVKLIVAAIFVVVLWNMSTSGAFKRGGGTAQCLPCALREANFFLPILVPMCLYCLNDTKFCQLVISSKSLKLSPPDVRFWFLGKNGENSISAGAPPHTPLESLQRSTRNPSWIKGYTAKGRREKKIKEGRMREEVGLANLICIAVTVQFTARTNKHPTNYSPCFTQYRGTIKRGNVTAPSIYTIFRAVIFFCFRF